MTKTMIRMMSNAKAAYLHDCGADYNTSKYLYRYDDNTDTVSRLERSEFGTTAEINGWELVGKCSDYGF